MNSSDLSATITLIAFLSMITICVSAVAWSRAWADRKAYETRAERDDARARLIKAKAESAPYQWTHPVGSSPEGQKDA